MTGGQKAAVILSAIIILAMFGYLGGWINPASDNYLLQTKPTGPGPKEGEEWLGGTFTLTVAGRNSLDASSSLTAGTDFTASFYGYRGGSWVFLGSEDGTGTNIESDATDDGYIWFLTEEISTKYYYADTSMTLSKNTYITDYKWVDADGDTDKEFLYKISLWNIPEPASGYPSRTFYPYYLELSNDGSYAASEALAWETQPSDISSVGTSAVTEYISWQSKLAATQQALGIYKIEIVVNDTDTTKWEIDKVNIPGVGYVDGSQFGEDVRSSDTKYQYIIGSDFNDIVYWKVPAGMNNKFDNTVAVKCTFGSSEAYTFTLYIYEWLYDRTSVSDNDGVVLSA